jgi:hypothetical protein
LWSGTGKILQNDVVLGLVTGCLQRRGGVGNDSELPHDPVWNTTFTCNELIHNNNNVLCIVMEIVEIKGGMLRSCGVIVHSAYNVHVFKTQAAVFRFSIRLYLVLGTS